MGNVNNVEIRIVNLARSGSHAIINWLIGLCNGKICFLNDVKPNRNPFLNFTEKELINIEEDEFNKNKSGKLTKKDLLICSYEQYPLKDIFVGEFEKNHDRYVGKSGRRIDILILRDPFNFFASRIKLEEYGIASLRIHLVDERSKKIITKLWKEYAKEYLNQTNHLKHNKLVISYNKWCLDKGYKKYLAKKLGFPFKDLEDKFVSKYGPGSSFDGRKYNGKASEMKVLERWKFFKDYPFYRDIFKDKELIGLSNKIFGPMEGTEILLEPQTKAERLYYGLKFSLPIIKGRMRYYAKKLIFPVKEKILLA